MGIAENVTTWYSDRQKAASWTIWATENPDKSAALTVAHNLALKLGLLKDWTCLATSDLAALQK